MIVFMSGEREEPTVLEEHLADALGNGLDNIARLMTGPVSVQYFREKFSNSLRSFLRVAKMADIDLNELLDTAQRAVNRSATVSDDDTPAWDVNKVWDEVVRRESMTGHRLDQIWTALQYENPYYRAEYPLANGRPYFGERPQTLDDQHSKEWHVQYGTENSNRLKNATVRAQSESDAVRNTFYVYPEATSVQINRIKHPGE
jgi:hypothetical protein